MAITTLSNVKNILNISDNDSDIWIVSLIPQVESDYLHIRNKPFNVGTKINVETTGLSADEDMTIDIGDSEYEIELKDGDTAGIIARRVVNQMKPNRYYEILAPLSNSTSADIYVTEKYENWTESMSVLDLSVTASTDITATVTKLQTIYPDGSELTAAQMIQHQMNKPAGVQSESLGDYSVTYAEMQGGYPRSITGQITRFAVTQ